MNVLKDLPKPLREILCAHEFLRRIGYPPEDIQVIYGDENGGSTVTVQGNWGSREISMCIGPCGYTVEEFGIMWPFAVEVWSNSTDDESYSVWIESNVFSNCGETLLKVVEKGMLRRELGTSV